MKCVWVFLGLLLVDNARAEVMTVTNVKVSVTADSAATAREKALDRAHDLAFQKLLDESFLENSGSLPPHDAVMNMVSDFSIDREKTTPTSYAASLTFQFDSPQVQAWLQQQSNVTPLSPQTSGKEKLFIMKASYTTLSEWQNIKKALETFPEVKKVTVLAFSPRDANVEITYGGSIEKLQQNLLQKGYLFSPDEKGWTITSNKMPL
ncbi:MAG TPA: hypothetical protein VMW10_09260 [Alphaproteobacteria bacterium]|nr:hypothetical protein [Alphaproteobacteria bacterium]